MMTIDNYPGANGPVLIVSKPVEIPPYVLAVSRIKSQGQLKRGHRRRRKWYKYWSYHYDIFHNPAKYKSDIRLNVEIRDIESFGLSPKINVSPGYQHPS